MIKPILSIAASEWQYWRRSHLALGSLVIFLLLFVASSLITAAHIHAEQHARMHQQTVAEETFRAQPDRHPHRMVHYGHYLFRAPAPLALFDPGLDTVTGQSIFLEGHRHNTVMFAESAASADFGGFSWLTPALIYQLFAPLVIILLGHGSVVREREAGVLTQMLAMGISGRTLILGKALALLSFVLLLLLPMMLSCAMALPSGASFAALLSLSSVYAVYLFIWVLLTLTASIILKKRTAVLALMTGFWFGLTLVLPSMAVNIASGAEPLAGKIETDLAMLADIRKLGDGHNANDPAFKQLRDDIFRKYGVERIEDLPVNFRGIVAMEGERKLSKVLNHYAKLRMASEKHQEKHISDYGWLTPSLAIAFVSRAIAGTDLEHYHRFQREAEKVRFGFIQGLNQAHVEQLSYQDDINRNKDEASSQRARVNAENWKVLENFHFKTTRLATRIDQASPSIMILLVWLFVGFFILIGCSSKVKP